MWSSPWEVSSGVPYQNWLRKSKRGRDPFRWFPVSFNSSIVCTASTINFTDGPLGHLAIHKYRSFCFLHSKKTNRKNSSWAQRAHSKWRLYSPWTPPCCPSWHEGEVKLYSASNGDTCSWCGEGKWPTPSLAYMNCWDFLHVKLINILKHASRRRIHGA